jgi:hypothetical protein
VLRRIFGRKRDEVTRGWITIHDQELHCLRSSPNLIRMLKSRRRRCSADGEKRIVYSYWGKDQRKETTGKAKAYVGG